MTEEQWVRAEDIGIWMAVAALSPRRQRLLASALVRSLGKWASGLVVEAALEANDRFADTGKTKVALKRAREELQNARLALGDPHADPATWAPNEGVFLALWTASVACSENAVGGVVREAARTLREADGLVAAGARRALYPAFREVAGPTPPVAFSPLWRTDTAVQLARQMYDSREFGAMPILADALQDAGCDSDEVLTLLR